MKLHIRNIALVFALLLLGGMVNEAWADVTYIILTKPFDVRNAANNDNYWTNIRLEALRCTSTGTTVYLPDEFRSPLATNFQYWKTPTVTANTRLYQTNGTTPDVLSTTYDIYNETLTGKMTENSTLASNDNPSVIYVTYDYNASNTILQLDGTQKYNVTLNTGNNLRFFAYNKNRGNRPAAAKGTTVSAEDLVSSVFTPNVGGFDGTKEAYYQFIFSGLDPYNITIGTAYSGNETYSEKLEVEGTAYKKPYAGGTIFAKLQSKNNNDGTANMWLSSDAHRHYKSTTDATSYDSWEGFYRSNMNPIFNAVALLPKGTSYFFVATKLNQNNTIYQPNNSGNYATLSDDGKNPRMIFKPLSNAISTELYPIYTYTFKVKTPFGNYVQADMEWSDYYISSALTVPETLKRKYTTITGFYAEDAHTNAVTTFADVQSKCGKDVDGKYIIYVDYSVISLPFESLPHNGSYANARWYTMRMNGDKEDINIVKYDGSSKFITGGGSDSDIHYGENSAEAMVAFIGDPYELRIVNRKTSETASANSYIGCASDATDATDFTARSSTSDKIGWEIVNDDVTGTFVLREFGTATAATPMYFGWHYGGTNNPIYYKTAGSRIKVVALEKKSYVYHIINDAGNIAVKMAESQDIGTPLRLKSIPELIRSPFLALPGVNIYYYWSKEDYDADKTAVAGGGARTGNKTNASYNPSTDGYDIYVAYTGMATALASSRVHFHTDQFFNVVLNGQYLYYSDGNINSKYPITDSEAGSDAYKWRLEGQDPYNMKIYNAGAYAADASKAYINTTFENDAALTFDAEAIAKSFVALSGTLENSFEVMAATGETLDIATNYYHIGRKTDNSVKMYDNTEVHGYASIRFMLTLTTSNVVYYHLIDKEHADLLQERSRYESLYFPADYRSPLVARYRYYPTKADADAGTNELTENATIATLIGANTIQDRDADGYPDVYVTYDTGTNYDLQNKRTMYLLKFDSGASFRQEDGSDGLTADPLKAVYPYCNGDGNFFVYGQEEYEKQQEGAANTRTRWAWFLESVHNDPYHVMICSRQIETYNSYDTRAYFHTYAETYNGAPHVVTNLSWPGISGVAGTEYMVLGAVGQFRLVTSNKVDVNADGDTNDAVDVRCTVNSFEQYWKTWNTIRKGKDVLNDADAVARQSDPNTVPATPATAVATAASKNNRTYLTDIMGWHCYSQWAYAVRWNGFNKAGKSGSKGWEDVEHWFQTVSMGEGYFDLVPTTIAPVLILLDKHGWEIMRKPLPNDPDDPEKEYKYNAIRPYDSPMVKEYHFWSNASKRSGFHQYYNLGRRISDNGVAYTSTSLTDLPPFDATNVHDLKGNLYDQYVTYVVKDEYAQSLGDPFLIQQGDNLAKNDNDAATIGKADVSGTGMSQYIINNASELKKDGSKENELWRLKPNPNIDQEMGYDVEGNPAHSWTSETGYEGYTGEFGDGFDPYNIQISSVSNAEKYFVSNSTGATLEEGGWQGTYSETPGVSLGDVPGSRQSATWYDSRTMAITNVTFMAVQDESGNMQLMPRFDHSRRLKDFSTLVAPNDAQIDKTYTKLYRPLVYNYLIMDNGGEEALRYRSGGDLVPQIPDQFKSPLAKDFEFYKEETYETQITESFAGVGLTNAANTVYVRYSYDDDADALGILKGKWFTMKLNNRDMRYTNSNIYYDLAVGKKESGVYSETISAEDKPATVDGDDQKWQWKFVADNFTNPDPYNINLYNRAKTDGPVLTKGGALLSHGSGGYLLAKNDGDYTYKCLKGKDIKTNDSSVQYAENAAAYSSESIGSATYEGVKGQILLYDNVEHTYTYKIYTNGTNGSNDVKYGVFAVQANQDYATARDNGYVPTLPDEIKSPLLNMDQFLYYGAEADMGNSTKELSNLFGLYDDIVYVRYTAYDLEKTEYKVPNVKDVVDSKVARGATSNDAALDINGQLIYNIIWYNDNMMKRGDGVAINPDASHVLDGSAAYVWLFEGNDPYAIKIKHKDAQKYAVGQGSLADDATSTFMLLPASDSWQYGVLKVTGGTNMLSGYGNTTVANDPTKFIIFGLSTHKVIYHLVIANINSSESIPYYDTSTSTYHSSYSISGSTHRDLTTGSGATYQLGSTIDGLNYCVDDGHITLGDPLKVPEVLERPNCKYFYYVGNIQTPGTSTFQKTAAGASDYATKKAASSTYTDDGYYYFRIGTGTYTYKRVLVASQSASDEVDCTEDDYNNAWQDNNTLNSTYKGHELPKMGTESELLGTKVLINIVYQFNDGLTTNNGSHFVTNTSGTQWYTFETNDATPYLANFTYKDNKMRGISGRVGHYTNEFLWSPVGDPYGFKMYNRYVYKNGNETTKVMTTSSTPAAGADLIMDVDSDPDKPVYELLPGYTDGYFKVQTLTVPGSGTPLYLDVNREDVKKKVTLSSSTTTEWTFGLNQSLFDPYILGAGNVGGLTTTPKTGTSKTKSGKALYEEATNLIEKQAVVFDPDNIVDFTSGYYRIFNQPNSQGITIPRYLSGYTHKTELDYDNNNLADADGDDDNIDAIPMHFYERAGVPTSFDVLGTGFTVTDATQGQIPISAPEYDPASIFYFTGTNSAAKMSTQGLYVEGNKMTATSGDATSFEVVDIGGAVVLLRNGSNYLHYKQTGNIYDVKFETGATFDDDDAAKWCMEPANKKGLWIETHSGGEEEVLTDLWYYSSYCVPFDLLIQNKNEDSGDGVGVHSSNAYTCVEADSPWSNTMLHPRPIGKYNTGTYADNDYFVPAGTPVLFSTKRATQYIRATIPTTTPSTPISTIFSYVYLEQKLPWDNTKRVYVFGPKMEGDFTLNTSNGDITATQPSLGNTNVGFHLNANLNKESGLAPATWKRNNFYVLHNRIYYLDNISGASAPSRRGIEFVPVIFDDEEGDDQEISDKKEQVFDGRVYNLQGRCVATEEQVKDGTWRDGLEPGIYIVNGKKLVITRK